MATISTVAGWNCSYSYWQLNSERIQTGPDTVQKSPEPPLRAPNLKNFSGEEPPKPPVFFFLEINLTTDLSVPTPLYRHILTVGAHKSLPVTSTYTVFDQKEDDVQKLCWT